MDLASSLNEFVRAQKSNDQTIHDERLKEFKSFLEREFQACFPPIKKSTTREEKEEDEFRVSNDTGLVGEEDEPLPVITKSYEEHAKELDDEQEELLNEAKQNASEAVQEKDYQKAAEFYRFALAIQPSAMAYAKRAECFIKLKRNLAAKQDCEQALLINPDSGKAMKVLGCALRNLGEYERATKMLSQGLAIDFDEESAKVEKEAEKFFHEIRVAKSKVKAKKDEEEKLERLKKIEERRKAMEEANEAMKNANTGGNGAGGGLTVS